MLNSKLKVSKHYIRIYPRCWAIPELPSFDGEERKWKNREGIEQKLSAHVDVHPVQSAKRKKNQRAKLHVIHHFVQMSRNFFNNNAEIVSELNKWEKKNTKK